MPKFLPIYLALLLAISEITLVSCSDAAINGYKYKTEEVEMMADSTPDEWADKGAVELDGVSFETLISDSILTIPEKGTGYETPLKLGIRIKNQTHSSVRFCLYDTAIPDLITSNGTHLLLEGGRNRSRLIRESDCPLVASEESVEFFQNGILFWKLDDLQMEILDGFGGSFRFEHLKPAIYRFRYRYYSNHRSTQISYPEQKILTNIWTGETYTPSREISLVLPKKT